jgi:predicted dehydrogenase
MAGAGTPFRFGVLGVSSFASKKMIPAIGEGRNIEVVAIASRSAERAAAAARELGIPRAHGSYEALLADPDVDGIYIPLPNHLHVAWSIKAAEAGKHVLCEKPIALHADEARRLVEVRDRCGVVIQEAAMARLHPRWLATRELVRKGKIGELRAFSGTFAYNITARENVRYDRAKGGGALLDVGFYPVTMARFCFDDEPTAASATIDRDPDGGVDRLISGMLRFPRGVATFVCGMQLNPFQRVDLVGTRGRIELDMAWNPVFDAPTRLAIDTSPRLETPALEPVEFGPCNHYTILAELFARAAREGTAAPIPLEDSIKNMAVIDALFRSAETGRAEPVLS